MSENSVLLYETSLHKTTSFSHKSNVVHAGLWIHTEIWYFGPLLHRRCLWNPVYRSIYYITSAKLITLNHIYPIATFSFRSWTFSIPLFYSVSLSVVIHSLFSSFEFVPTNHETCFCWKTRVEYQVWGRRCIASLPCESYRNELISFSLQNRQTSWEAILQLGRKLTYRSRKENCGRGDGWCKHTFEVWSQQCSKVFMV